MGLRKIWAAVAAAAVVVFLWAAPAVAQVAEDGNASPDAPLGTVFTINNTLVNVLLGFVVPVVNGFLLRPNNPAWLKVLMSQVVGTVAYELGQRLQDDGTAMFTQEWLVGLAMTSAIMIVSYMGFWKPVVDPNQNIPTGLNTPAV